MSSTNSKRRRTDDAGRSTRPVNLFPRHARPWQIAALAAKLDQMSEATLKSILLDRAQSVFGKRIGMAIDEAFEASLERESQTFHFDEEIQAASREVLTNKNHPQRRGTKLLEPFDGFEELVDIMERIIGKTSYASKFGTKLHALDAMVKIMKWIYVPVEGLELEMKVYQRLINWDPYFFKLLEKLLASDIEMMREWGGNLAEEMRTLDKLTDGSLKSFREVISLIDGILYSDGRIRNPAAPLCDNGQGREAEDESDT